VPGPGLSVRALNALDTKVVGHGEDVTRDALKAWAERTCGPGHTLDMVRHALRRLSNVGEQTADEIMVFAYGLPRTSPLKQKLYCSICGDRAVIEASGHIGDKFVQWWAAEHKHERTKETDNG
jgi:hypothetical protein